MLLNVTGTPYYLTAGAGTSAIQSTLRELTERVELLRAQGRLTASTLHDYYGEKRFEQIAESNALEGSTLSIGETELAVLKGIAISGQRLHDLILGGRPGAGIFRTGEVRIRGSKHVPPRTWPEIMGQMKQWQAWSRDNAAAPTLFRATVLHAWLEHIHPFQDGNGRTGRAVTLAFYTEKLGFAVATDQSFGEQRWIELRIPGAQTRLVLFTPDGHEDRIGTFTSISFQADDVAATYAELSRRGVEFEGPPTAAEWGTFAIFKDPDGNSFVLGSG